MLRRLPTVENDMLRGAVLKVISNGVQSHCCFVDVFLRFRDEGWRGQSVCRCGPAHLGARDFRLARAYFYESRE